MGSIRAGNSSFSVLAGVTHLIIAEDENGAPIAFMGIENGTLEMLFVSPEERGKGLGKTLLRYAIERYGVERLAVNEQNPQAKGFYEHRRTRQSLSAAAYAP